MAIAPMNLSLPPAVVLMTKDGEDVALAEAKLFWNRSLVHV